ncbi:unnamed protein product [Polarella glacialis]|uniref:3-dehydroquinate synthase domain-containing protein n=1 Tax=Polarella glacialis TaxID=89957 RepID=A0A813DMH0_POLGL|nr:unnamed protein product [Polarella glacialis]
MACTKCASLSSGPAFLQPVQSTRPRPASSLGQPPVQGDMSSVAAAGAATASATASAVLAVAGAVSLGAASGRRRAAKLPKVVRLQGAQNMPSPTLEINYYELDAVEAPRILSAVRLAIKMASPIVQESTSPEERLLKLLSEPSVQSMLTTVSRLPVFSKEMALAFKDDLDLLLALKQLKYFWNLPQSQLAILLEVMARQLEGPSQAAPFQEFLRVLTQTPNHAKNIKHLRDELPAEVKAEYLRNADYLETADAHAVYPTSIYRQCDGFTLATKDASTIEAVMSTTLTTTIKIARKVLEPSNHLLYNIYKPLGRCVAVVDDKVDAIYGKELDAYFAGHGIEFKKIVSSGNEADKDIRDVERILVSLKKAGQGRHEPLLVVGGGVIADIAGFAAALYSRNTPYVMLCTSIVSGIDAGPSPRVCCNGFDYKNLYGAYHPPVLTITDRGFWKSLHPGWLRHGVAEIIKMAVMKDLSLFELVEQWGPKCLETKFGTVGDSVNDPAFQDVCDLIVGKAMEGYVRSEYGNLWETHQCRPHAYGHTWCPGYELPSGMLHGQAVGTCMGFGAYLAMKSDFIPEIECQRILKVISDCELCLWHPIMEDGAAIWRSQVAMIEKRGGNLAAPIPRPLGESGYLNDLSEEMLLQRLQEYKSICLSYPRQGRGVEEHCTEVGLADPQSNKVAPLEDRFVVTPTDLMIITLTKTQDMAAVGEVVRMLDGVDGMVVKYSTQPSEALRNISVQTAKTNPNWAEMEKKGATSKLLEAEMISGQAEGQLLQLLVKFGKVKKVLDIGTFTGYSSLAMAEALPEDGRVVTLERQEEAAKMAAENWASSPHAGKIESRVGEAQALLQALASQGESFDLVFLDVDKPGYFALYQTLMETGLLRVGGLLAVDNTMYKGEELTGERLSVNGEGARALNAGLLADDRVLQVMLPLRDGLTLAFRQH